jgi:hypothetical protein
MYHWLVSNDGSLIVVVVGVELHDSPSTNTTTHIKVINGGIVKYQVQHIVL